MTHTTIIQLTVHGASGLTIPPPPQLQCVAQIESCRRCTAVANTSGGEAATEVEWQEDLKLEASPEARSLKLVLQRPTHTGSSQFVAAGSVGISPLLGGNVPCYPLAVPVVDEVGKHAGQVNCTLVLSGTAH